jgi:hypothetical protein
MIAVITPTGNWAGEIIVRAIVSQMTTKAAPSNALVGNS